MSGERKAGSGAVLTPAQIEELSAMLTKVRIRIEGLLSGHGSSTPDDEEGPRQELAVPRRRRLEARLEQIRHAIGRVTVRTYGECVACRGPIGFARLSVQPEALRCKPCQVGD